MIRWSIVNICVYVCRYGGNRMFCTNCGQQLPDGSRFCTSCGAQLGSAAPNAGPINSEPMYNGTFSLKQEEGKNR